MICFIHPDAWTTGAQSTDKEILQTRNRVGQKISFSDRYIPNFFITDYLVLTVEETPLKRTWLSPLGLDSLVTPLLNTEMIPEPNDKHMNSYLRFCIAAKQEGTLLTTNIWIPLDLEQQPQTCYKNHSHYIII